ncbi:hydrogenase maturation nickel metallochaperone HypA [Alteromonas antoniana]|uniref:hydrogenase maturation nickel metallochaperone HypA/HybF n=1 Tax=Alteromonas antoniana TaxID=2803813 RepID=UPI001C4658C4|nr:hydrogenase maturation nickel metallochaperone HypA [Alteromonas antoniana]
MHEMSLCYSLLDTIAVHQRANMDKRVGIVHVKVGPLSGVEPDLLHHAFLSCRTHTIGDQATLKIDTSAIKVRCKLCGEQSYAVVNRIICASCGSWHTELIQGDEFVLQRIEFIPSEISTEPKERQYVR